MSPALASAGMAPDKGGWPGNGLGSNDNQAAAPTRPPAGQEDPKQAIGNAELRASGVALPSGVSPPNNFARRLPPARCGGCPSSKPDPPRMFRKFGQNWLVQVL